MGDRDVRHAAAVAVLANLLTLGGVWLGYLVWVGWVAARSRTRPPCGMRVLVFGKRLRGDRPGPDFHGRLARAQALVAEGLTDHLMLLGGRSGGALSEAEAAQRWLSAAELPPATRLTLEQESVDSLENLRHARVLLRQEAGDEPLPPVALLTSRYHLARCLMLARRLGLDSHPVAAEQALGLDPSTLAKLLVEATYVMWIDLGVRWALLVGNQRMAARMH